MGCIPRLRVHRVNYEGIKDDISMLLMKVRFLGSFQIISDLPKAAQLFLRKQGSSFCDYADRLEREGEDAGRARGEDGEEL